MPYVRITSPKLSLEQKKRISKEITEAILQALHLPPEAKYWTTIHFTPFHLEDMAIGGRLLSEDIENVDYHIEIHERNLDERKKKALVDELTPLFANLFNLDATNEEQLSKINIMLSEYKPGDFAIGGKFIHDIEHTRSH